MRSGGGPEAGRKGRPIRGGGFVGFDGFITGFSRELSQLPTPLTRSILRRCSKVILSSAMTRSRCHLVSGASPPGGVAHGAKRTTATWHLGAGLNA